MTRGPVALVTAEALFARLDRGQALPEGLKGAWISEQAGLAFPIIRGVHVFLADQALRLSGQGEQRAVSCDTGKSVRDWYDSFGWRKGEGAVYGDTRLFSGTGMTPLRRYHEASHLLVAERLGDGDLLLDAASGPIAQPEYLSYQKGFARRVCVDFSMTAPDGG